MTFHNKLYSICLALGVTLFCQGAWAQEKALVDAEKCLNAAIQAERQKTKPRATSIVKACTRELEALLAYSSKPVDSTPGSDGKLPDSSGREPTGTRFEDLEVVIRNPKPLDSIN